MFKKNGTVLFSSPAGEYDRRLVILTAESGKISAFAKGAQKPKSSMRAGARPFSCGTFELNKGRSAYTVTGMRIKRYFEGLLADGTGYCLASYFAEFADYYCRENMDCVDFLNLLYMALDALEKKSMDRTLIRRAFELRAMCISGEYTKEPFAPCGKGASRAWGHCVSSPISALFSFRLSDASKAELGRAVDAQMAYYMDRKFRSLEILSRMAADGAIDL